jgi:hypothetical protein
MTNPYDPNETQVIPPVPPEQPVPAPYWPVTTEPQHPHRGRNILITISVFVVLVVVGGIIAASLSGPSNKRVAGSGLIAPATYSPPPTIATDAPAPTPTDDSANLQNMALGSIVEQSGFDLDAGDPMVQEVAALTAKFRTTGCGEFGDKAKRGMKYLVVGVSYSVTTGKGEYNPFDWSLTDNDGNGYDSDSGIFSDCGTLDSSNSAHGKHKGTIVFAVPASFKHGILILDNGGDSVSWAL